MRSRSNGASCRRNSTIPPEPTTIWPARNEDLPNGDEVITRRYEFYKYAGPLDPETNEAKCDNYPQISDPADPKYKAECDPATVTVLGDYIGAQMAGFNVEAVLGLVDHIQDGDLDEPYTTRTVVVGGNTPYVTSVTSGALPAGLNIDSPTGVLSGTPTAAGAFSFTITATDADAVQVTKAYTMTIAGLAGRLRGDRLHRLRCMPRGRNLRSGHGRVLESDGPGRDGVQRRRCLHADRCVRGGCMHGQQSGELRGVGYVPRGRHLRSVDGRVLESDGPGRGGVQRRRCLHADRCVRGRCMHGQQSGELRGMGCVPRGRYLRSVDRRVLESDGPDGAACSDGNACTQTDTCWPVHARAKSGELHGVGCVPRGRYLRSVDRRVLESDGPRRDRMQ